MGASSVAQSADTLGALDRLDFSPDELTDIDRSATESGVNLWAESSDAWNRRQNGRVPADPGSIAVCRAPIDGAAAPQPACTRRYDDRDARCGG